MSDATRTKSVTTVSDETCWWCAGPAEYLCDTLLLPPLATGQTWSLEDGETCDAPMCAGHAMVVGFMCEPGPGEPLCGAPTKAGGRCQRVSGEGRCHQHADVAPEHAADPELHACPFCVSLGEMPRKVDAAEHRRATRVHGGRSQMEAVR